MLQTVNRPYFIAGFVLLAGSIFIAYISVSMRFYTPFGPGPGFFPLILSTMLGILSVALIVQSIVGAADMPKDTFSGVDRLGYLRVVLLIAVLLATGPSLQFLGYQVTMAMFFFVLLKILGGRSWLVSAGVGLIFSIGTFQLFAVFLRVPLPRGVLGF